MRHYPLMAWACTATAHSGFGGFRFTVQVSELRTKGWRVGLGIPDV